MHFAAGDDERGESWAHFVLVSQGLLGSGAIKRFSTDSSDYQELLLHDSLEVLPAGQGAERCSWCEISGEAFLHELTMNSALYPVYKRWQGREAAGPSGVRH